MSAILAAVRHRRLRLLAGWLASCGLLFLLAIPQAQATTRQVGIDIPVQWYTDDSGQMTLDRFSALLSVINMAASVVAISHDHYLNIRHYGAVESPQLQADAGLLCIAIANLLDNAVKYSPPGEIAIDIRSEAGHTELRIRDHGPGLPDGQAELIFERYRRGEHTSPVPGGTGLGLYVARQIVQAHDGKLWLAEHGPGGCTFILTLPTVA